MELKKIFVVGCGFMGTGIIENAATKGLDVIGYDVSLEQTESSRERLCKYFSKAVQRGKMSEEDKDIIFSRIRYVTDMSECKDADIIIEAASENKEVKMKIMKEIDKYAKADAIIGSNTSSISITSLGHAFKDPSRFVGLHFFSPVPKMPLMEIVKGYLTSEEILDTACKFGEYLGKSCIIAHDEAGFIINRMLLPMLNEACLLVERNIGNIEEIDMGMKKGLNHPMGPLELMDMIGIDVELAVMEVLHEEIGDPKYRPAISLRRMVDAGFLGRKSGKGFYIYNDDNTKVPNEQLQNIR